MPRVGEWAVVRPLLGLSVGFGWLGVSGVFCSRLRGVLGVPEALRCMFSAKWWWWLILFQGGLDLEVGKLILFTVYLLLHWLVFRFILKLLWSLFSYLFGGVALCVGKLWLFIAYWCKLCLRVLF